VFLLDKKRIFKFYLDNLGFKKLHMNIVYVGILSLTFAIFS
jgi:hypothetical protein